jgi:hypothetical protein
MKPCHSRGRALSRCFSLDGQECPVKASLSERVLVVQDSAPAPRRKRSGRRLGATQTAGWRLSDHGGPRAPAGGSDDWRQELALPTPFQRWHLERCSAQESPPRAGNQATECDCQRVGHPGDWRQGILENISTKGSASFLLTKGSLARLAEEIIKERGSRFDTLTIVMKRPIPWGSSFSPQHRERMERSSLEPFNPSPANDDLNRRIRRMNPRIHADHRGWRVATPHVLVR